MNTILFVVYITASGVPTTQQPTTFFDFKACTSAGDALIAQQGRYNSSGPNKLSIIATCMPIQTGDKS